MMSKKRVYGNIGSLLFLAFQTSLLKNSPGGKMAEPIIIYSNGEQYEADSDCLYEPFPETSEEATDESQE